MLNVSPYLIFNGNCKEAMDFYKTHLNGESYAVTYGETQGDKCPPGMENKIIHSNLKKGNFLLMASDTHGEVAKTGDNVQLYLHCESKEEVDRVYKAFSTGGNGKYPPENTFWGAYFGMTVDKFGINWMLGFDLPK